MGAVSYRFRAELRRRGTATLVLVVLVGLAGGAVIAALSGARRTASSYTRLLRDTTTSDALVNPDDDSFPMEEAERLPQVKSWSLLTGTGIAPIRQGQPDFSLAGTTATSDGRFGYSTDRPYDLQGRMPAGPDEVFLSSGVARPLGLGVGDRAPFWHLISQSEQGDRTETLDLTVTGIGTTVYETLQPPGQGFDVILLPPAFARAHPSAPVFSGLEVRLRGGDGDAAAFAREIAGLAGGHPVFVQRQSATTAKAQQALRPYVGALAAFAAALALTALLILGQALSRHLATLATDDATLASAGMSRRQLALLAGLRAGAVGAGGALVAVVVAAAASPLMPIGPSHAFEPSPGPSFDGLVVPAGAVALAGLSLAFGAARGLRRRRTPAATRPGRADRLAALLRPAQAAGLRMALDPGRRDRAVPARATVAGAALGLAAVTASLTFGASLHQFLSTPRLYGWAWDAQVDLSTNQGNELSAIESAPGVADATPGVNSIVSVEGASVPAIGLGHGAPALHPPLLEGRAPQRADEIALGSDTLRKIGHSVGDRVTVGVGEQAATMQIVGRATFSRFAAYPGADKTGLGVGAQLTLEGLARVVPHDEGLDFVLVHLAGGRVVATRLGESLAATFADAGPDVPQVRFDPQRPDDLLGYDRVDRTPLALAGLLVLLSAGATSHGLVAAIRRRRGELAVLRAVGFTGGDVRAAVRWQSGIIAAVAGAVGLPVGIVLGRLSWTALAERLGTPAGPVVPAAALAVLVTGTLLVAVAVAEAPARRAARIRPALVLRAE